MPASPTTSLHVRQMRVIWRDTFVIENPAADFLADSRERLSALACYLSDSRVEPARTQPEALRVIERVSRNVAGIGYPDLLRIQFAPFQITNLRPTLARLRRSPDALTADQIWEAAAVADADGRWLDVTPFVLLHCAGVGIMQYHVAPGASPPGFNPDEAIELVRMGFSSHLLRLPDDWRVVIAAASPDWERNAILAESPDIHLTVVGLRDISQNVVEARLGASPPTRRRRRRARSPQKPPERPTGSTTVILSETDPLPVGALGSFVAQHAVTLRGIGALDTYYRERAASLVERELTDNLSADREAAVYLLGNSELILYNDELPPIAEEIRARLHLKAAEHAVTYLYMHYAVLLEWVYLQEAILHHYLHRLDNLAAAPRPRRPEMVAALQGALSDLVQYQEDITPFATRVEFLERARRYHKIDTLAERFERKQELLLSYASEFHDYRDARASQFLNWLAGILTGAALADLIITLAGITPEQTVLYLGITGGSILLVLGVLAALLRFL